MEVLTSLKCVSYIYYPVIFWEGSVGSVSAPINLGSKVNAMHPAYIKKLDFIIWKTDVGAQKIDSTTLKTFKVVIAAFSIYNRAKKFCFFEKTFLLADISIDMALKPFFFTLSNANIYFTNWRLY